MIPLRPGDSMAASNHFSFSQSPQRSQEHGDHRINTIDYGMWTRPPRSPVNPVVEEEFQWLARKKCTDDSDGSGTPSPPLWKNYSPSRTPPRPTMSRTSESCPARDEVNTYLNSRAQVIAGYRREMLDLVRGLPESAYELSLRDIVETQQHKEEEQQMEEVPLQERGIKEEEEGKKKRKKLMSTGSTNRRIARSASMDTGLLIKMFLPLSVGGKKKSFGANSGANAMVSPKPNSKEKEKEKQENNKLPIIKEGKKKREKKEKQKEKMVAVMEEKEEEEEEEWWEKSEFSDNQGAGNSSGTSSGTSSRTSSTGSNSNGNTIGGNTTTRTASLRSRSRYDEMSLDFFCEMIICH